MTLSKCSIYIHMMASTKSSNCQSWFSSYMLLFPCLYALFFGPTGPQDLLVICCSSLSDVVDRRHGEWWTHHLRLKRRGPVLQNIGEWGSCVQLDTFEPEYELVARNREVLVDLRPDRPQMLARSCIREEQSLNHSSRFRTKKLLECAYKNGNMTWTPGEGGIVAFTVEEIF